MAKNVYRVMVGDDAVVAGDDQVVVTLEDALSAVDKLEDLVHSIKQEVKDFIRENWDELLEKLTGIDVPENLLEQYPDFYQYLERVLQLVGLV